MFSSTQLDPNSNELAAWLRRCIVISGYCLAGWQFVVTFMVAITMGRQLHVYFTTDWPLLGKGLLGALYVMSMVLLVVGCWGLQHYRRWARPILLGYAIAWIFGQFAGAVVSCVAFHLRSANRSNLPFLLTFFVDPAVWASVYPIALVLLLRRRELRDQFPKMRRGFAPVFQDDAGSA